MTVRILVTGDPEYDNEHHVSALLESEFRLAVGQVIEVFDRTTGNLHEIVQEIIAERGGFGLTIVETPGSPDAHVHFGASAVVTHGGNFTRVPV